jgi:D-beta-D-heptose 7-phosphate kinase/D-beta-D-heptose 1-phosphate adenosyltransferase
VIRSLRDKIKTSKALASILRREQKRGRKVVFTNGCFDLLHKGHVTYLEKARRKGDLLIVALNSDASVRRLKGPKRPLNYLSARQAVMAALESVDYVTSFSQDTPLALIRALRPDVLIKGGDYRIEQIVGAEDVFSWGGKVFTISFVKGHSTTKIISRAGQGLTNALSS